MTDESKKPEGQAKVSGKGTGRKPPPAEYRWKKGQSGNPKGGPRKEVSITALVKEELEKQADRNGEMLFNKDGSPKTWAQLVAMAIVRRTVGGNSTAMKELLDRVDGKVPQPLQHTGRDGEPIEVNVKNERQKIRELLEDPDLRDATIAIAQKLNDGGRKSG
jgi:hypothetical protein